MTLAPLPYQVPDLQKLAAGDHTGMIAVEVGGGKTYLAVANAVASGAQVKLVVAPTATHRGEGWEWHVNELDPQADFRVLGNGTKAGRSALADLEWSKPGWYVLTPQLFTRLDLSSIRPDMAIVDESHLLSTYGRKGNKKYRALGLVSGARVPMSGTPLRNRFENMYSTMRFAYPHLDSAGEIADRSYYRWLEREMASEYDRFAYNNRKYVAERAPGEFVKRIPTYIQHFRRVRCCDFHPNGFLLHDEPNVVEEVIPLTSKQRRAISDLETQYLTHLTNNPLTAENDLSVRLRVSQMTLGMPHVTDEGEVLFADDCESPKLDRLLELLEDLRGEPVVVFTSSQKFAAVAVQRMAAAGISAFEWSGKTDRSEALTRFRSGELQVIVATIQAAGTGLNGLQKVAKTEVWLDRHVDPVLNEQAEGRLDRHGARGQVQRFLLHDDEGRDQGVLSKQVEARILLNRSLRLAR